MTTIHDDRPHPIPAFAYLRYKENYFFIAMDPERQVFCVSHFNNEPIFNRSRFSIHLNLAGKRISYANQTPIPDDFEGAEQLSDGKLTLKFVKPHQRFDVSYHGDDADIDLVFEAHCPTFDYGACRTAAPENPNFQEVMTLGMNLPFNHQQQGLTSRGTITLKGEAPVQVNGYGYRDHSWVMRTDNVVKRHFWTGLVFPKRVFGMKTLETINRPGIWAKEGYVSDADGERALRFIEVTEHGQQDGWPKTLQFAFRDVLGKPFTIEIDFAGRHADVPLHAEVPVPGKPYYEIMETSCPLTILETGEKGVGLIETGRTVYPT